MESKEQEGQQAKQVNQPKKKEMNYNPKPIEREKIEDAMMYMIDQVEKGNTEAVQTFLDLRQIEQIAKYCQKQIEEQTIAEVNDNHGRIDRGNLIIEARSSAGRWKFTDDGHAALKQQLKDAEELRKQAHKLHLKGSEVIDPETGEIVPPADYTPGKETIFISKARKS